MGTEGATSQRPDCGTNDNANNRSRPRIRWLLLGIFCLCLFWACLSAFICESNGGVFIVFLSGILAWVLIAGFCFARWGGYGLAAGIVIAPIGLALLFPTEVAVFSWILHGVPTPRPMFCNDFAGDERALLPDWRDPTPIVDRFGHWGYADYEDNLLLIVVTGVPKTSRFQDLSPGTHESTIAIGDDSKGQFTVLQRTQNALVVILPSGDSKQFALKSGLARQFHQERCSKNVDNVLREAGELLEPAERAEFTKFLTRYTEPRSK